MENKKENTCPRCGLRYSERPALSRADNKTNICPDCGTRESLETIGMDKEKQEQIINEIHKLRG